MKRADSPVLLEIAETDSGSRQHPGLCCWPRWAFSLTPSVLPSWPQTSRPSWLILSAFLEDCWGRGVAGRREGGGLVWNFYSLLTVKNGRSDKVTTCISHPPRNICNWLHSWELALSHEGFWEVACWHEPKCEKMRRSLWNTLRRKIFPSHKKIWRPVVAFLHQSIPCYLNNNKNWNDFGKGLIWKDPDAGKDWGQEEKRTTEGEMAGWHHWLDGHEFE